MIQKFTLPLAFYDCSDACYRKADVQVTRAMRFAEGDTDHALLRSILSLHLRPRRQRTAPYPLKKLDVERLRSTVVRNELRAALRDGLEPSDDDSSLESKAQKLFTKIYEYSELVLKHPRRRHADWFDDNDQEIRRLLYERNVARQALLSGGSRGRYCKLKATAQRRLRGMKDTWWKVLAEEMETLFTSGDSKAFFAAMKLLYGPRGSTTGPIKSKDGQTLMTDRPAILERWQEYFSDLLNQTSSVDVGAVEEIPRFPVLPDLDKPPSLIEGNRSIPKHPVPMVFL